MNSLTFSFLALRLDPMPNVASTLHCAVSQVCFDGASGIAELLKRTLKLARVAYPTLILRRSGVIASLARC